ncbi:hypothetical protein KORDIASMS9_01796 [Kordia sp. SMS9]|uniref:hypothetical protein n=1 Tax=Kordia sp. SMS9 TaxID=2282170 RepID=UPI000E0D2501|nr:hypothetical protein [Kordia sp. SMS9]AXG69573.1 hypothetical protein KORDIASMS9_01796 [Kordia sp. SMS9]
MNDRFKIAIKNSDLSTQKVAESIGLKANTLRKALLRNSLNDGYLILIEQNCGISRKWLKDGVKPIFVDSKENIIKRLIEQNTLEALDKFEKEKIIAYILLKEAEFLKIPAFQSLIDKIKVSAKISDIINRK